MNPYIPNTAKITEIKDETPDTKTFTIETNMQFRPGQFVELSVFGYGEAPISISGGDGNSIDLTIRAVGNVTNKIHEMQPGDVVGLRGPFGNGWPYEKAKKKNLLIVAGGIGLAPLRPVVEYVMQHRAEFEDVTLLYGARKPSLMLFKYRFDEWAKKMDLLLTVDEPEPGWTGHVGVVTTLCDKIRHVANTITLMCGPPVMMKYVSMLLIELGFPPSEMYLSLERNMKCGIGICGHCAVGGVYVCRDGPVFPLHKALRFVEKPHEVQGVLD
ncbi:MAG: oxidoreductase [Euryarchaeota archaeon]|nr:oxidoreductase [Euryarchaeota archaeon]